MTGVASSGAGLGLDAGAEATIGSIARLGTRPGRLLVVADFDGTLAEGSRDPGATRIVPLARRAIRHLARLAAAEPDRLAIAILTGRTAADVAGRVRVGGIVYLGDHGLQSGTFRRGGDPARLVTTFPAGHEASLEPAALLADRVPEVRPAGVALRRAQGSVRRVPRPPGRRQGRRARRRRGGHRDRRSRPPAA